MHQSYEGLDRPGGFSRVRLLAPLAHRDYRLLVGGMSVSLLGDGLFLVALAWQVYSLSDAPTALASVGIAMTVPTIACLLIGGAVSDRCERRRVMLAADAVRAVLLAALAVLALTGALRLWHLLVIAVGYGAATAFFNPASDALVPQLLPAEELAQANSLDQLIRPLALRLAGPALGGLLIGSVGTGWAFALDAVLVRGLDRDPVGDGAGPGAVDRARVRGARSQSRPALRARQPLDLGDAGQRRGRLPAVHGADRGAAPVRRQAQARRRRDRPRPDLRRRRARLAGVRGGDRTDRPAPAQHRVHVHHVDGRDPGGGRLRARRRACGA